MSSRRRPLLLFFLHFSFNYSTSTEIYTLSLHDALPIFALVPAPLLPPQLHGSGVHGRLQAMRSSVDPFPRRCAGTGRPTDRKSTRLNSSHVKISYAVFCLKKKKKILDEFVLRLHDLTKN